MNRKNFISSVFGLSLFPVLKAQRIVEASQLKPTCEPSVWIMEQKVGYIKYCEKQEGEIVKVWEVHGICTGIGKCYEGATNEKPILDCPVNEYFKKDCCPLQVNVLWKKEGYAD